MSNITPNPHIVYIDHSWGEVAVSKRVMEDSKNDADATTRPALVLGNRPTRTAGDTDARRARLLAALSTAQSTLVWALVSLLILLVLGVAGCLDSERGGAQWRGEKMQSRRVE